MTKWTPQTLVVSVALTLVWGCDAHHHHPCSSAIGSGQLATETRTVQGFESVEVSAAGHLIVEQTGVESLQVTVEDNLLPLVWSEVRDGRLILGLEPGASVNATREVLFRLTVRDVREIEASGASRVEVRGVNAAELAFRLSGASSLVATGRAAHVRLELSGASLCETPDLQAHTLAADLSGASYARVRVSRSLTVSASGASILDYLGDPEVAASVTGGSVVRRAGP